MSSWVEASYSLPVDSILSLVSLFLNLDVNIGGKLSQNMTHYHSPWVLKRRQGDHSTGVIEKVFGSLEGRLGQALIPSHPNPELWFSDHFLGNGLRGFCIFCQDDRKLTPIPSTLLAAHPKFTPSHVFFLQPVL